MYVSVCVWGGGGGGGGGRGVTKTKEKTVLALKVHPFTIIIHQFKAPLTL